MRYDVVVSDFDSSSSLRTFFQQDKYKDRGVEWLDWKFARNPHGLGKIFLATKDSEIVGFLGFIPRYFDIGGDRITSYQAVDGFITPTERGKGVFNLIVQNATDFFRSKESIFLFGLPNSDSIPAFLKKDWVIIGNIRKYIYPLNFELLVRTVRRLHVLWPLGKVANYFHHHFDTNSRFPEKVIPCPGNVFDKAFSMRLKLFAVRDADYLNWRFVSNPMATYTNLYFDDGRGNILGFCSLKIIGNVVTMMDLVISDKYEICFQRLFEYLFYKSISHICYFCLPDDYNARLLRKVGFWNFETPDKLIVFSNLKLGELFSKSAFVLSLGDSDWP